MNDFLGTGSEQLPDTNPKRQRVRSETAAWKRTRWCFGLVSRTGTCFGLRPHSVSSYWLAKSACSVADTSNSGWFLRPISFTSVAVVLTVKSRFTIEVLPAKSLIWKLIVTYWLPSARVFKAETRLASFSLMVMLKRLEPKLLSRI